MILNRKEDFCIVPSRRLESGHVDLVLKGVMFELLGESLKGKVSKTRWERFVDIVD